MTRAVLLLFAVAGLLAWAVLRRREPMPTTWLAAPDGVRACLDTHGPFSCDRPAGHFGAHVDTGWRWSDDDTQVEWANYGRYAEPEDGLAPDPYLTVLGRQP